MPSWKKVIVSGSSPHFNEISSSGGMHVTSSNIEIHSDTDTKLRIRRNQHATSALELSYRGSTGPLIHSVGKELDISTDTSGIALLPSNGIISINDNSEQTVKPGALSIQKISGINYLAVASNSNSSTEGDIFLITGSNGNVGIANKDPQEKLDVTGNIQASGNISGSAASTGSFGRLTLTDANSNVAIRTNYDGNASVIIGDSTTGASLTTEVNNVVIGQGISAISGGENNVYIGAGAAAANASPNNCVAIGYQAMSKGHANERSVAIGFRTLYGDGSGYDNVAVGHSSGYNTTGGEANVFVGRNSGPTNTTGDQNVTIGSNADVSIADAQNQIAIGYNVTSTGNNQTVIGNSSQTHVVFGGSALISGSATSTGSFGHIMVGGANFSSASLASSGISNVVEDTTPQLGGNLDANGNDISGSAILLTTGGAWNRDNDYPFNFINLDAQNAQSFGMLVRGGANAADGKIFTGMGYDAKEHFNVFGDGSVHIRETLTIGGGIRTAPIGNERIHIHRASANGSFMRFTNTNSGHDDADNSGIIIGQDDSEQAQFMNQEDADMFFGVNKIERLRITTDNKISGSLTSTGSFGSLVVSDKVQGDLTVVGNIVAEQYIISSSVTHLTQSFSSGSTIFGDTLDDRHRFTGSLFISASDSTGVNIQNTDVETILGANAGVNGYVGTKSNTPFNIATNNVRIAHFTTGGSLGVGAQNDNQVNLSSVTRALTINGSGAVIMELAQGATRLGNVYHDGTNMSMYNNANGTLSFGTNNTERMKISSDASSTEFLTTKISGSITSTGSFGAGFIDDKLGIDTTAPQEKLDISGGNIRLDDGQSLNFASTDGNIGRVRIIGSEDSDYLRFNTDNAIRMAIVNQGVVIGTNVTSTAVGQGGLEVRGNISGSGTSTGSFGSYNNDFIPSTDNTHDLGSATNRWANIHSADLQLNNENTSGNEIDGTTGNWTIQEGNDDLFIINRKTGKKYKFLLEEVK